MSDLPKKITSYIRTGEKIMETFFMEQIAALAEQNTKDVGCGDSFDKKLDALKDKPTGQSFNNGGIRKEEEMNLRYLPKFNGCLDPNAYLEWERWI